MKHLKREVKVSDKIKLFLVIIAIITPMLACGGDAGATFGDPQSSVQINPMCDAMGLGDTFMDLQSGTYRK